MKDSASLCQFQNSATVVILSYFKNSNTLYTANVYLTLWLLLEANYSIIYIIDLQFYISIIHPANIYLFKFKNRNTR